MAMVTKMKIPKRIHFAGFDYEIKIVKHLDGDDSWGRTDIQNQQIFIEKDMPLQHQMQTLIHELMHVAYRHTFGEVRADEEKKTKAWSKNIYGILKDNDFLK